MSPSASIARSMRATTRPKSACSSSGRSEKESAWTRLASQTEHPVRSQDAMRLAQDPELVLRGWDVVEHSEAADRVERLLGEGRARGVADLDLDVRAGEVVREPRGGVRVELECYESLHVVTEPPGGRARPRAELEHLVAE